jgi:dihydroxyacetone kinase-like protein
MRTAAEIVDFSLDAIHSDMPLTGDLAVLVNGMGATPLIELYLVFNEVTRVVKAKGAKITRSLVGNYITSLDMAGVSITVVRLTPDLTELWDAPVQTPSLRWGR